MSKYEALESEDEGEDRYGWGRYSPNALQVFNSPKWATGFFCLASLVQGVTINGLLHYFLPTIERRFALSSTESGTMSGAYDMAAMLCVIPVTYLGGRRGSHRPRYIGIGLLLLGTGSLIFSLPAFFGGAYSRASRKDICDPTGKSTRFLDDDKTTPMMFWLLFIGNFLHGIGASPLYTLAVTYIDDNVPVDSASLYLGVYFMMAVVGPFLGMAGGGLLSQVDGDIVREKMHFIEITPESPAWVGCWWCGFILCGICAFIFSIPILGLPKELKEEGSQLRERERLQDSKKTMTFSSAAQLPRAVFEVIKGVKFDFIVAAGCAETLIFSGVGAFLAKILILQFGLSAFQVALYMSIITIPSTLIGIYFGSSMIKFLKMGVKQILLMNVLLMACSAPTGFAVFISCPGPGVVGISRSYALSSSPSSVTTSELSNLTLDAECNEDCHCDERNFNPVCGSDALDYFSACYAGCRLMEEVKSVKMYRNCSCILVKNGTDFEAATGTCSLTCPLFPLFVVLIFLYLFFSFSALIPSITAILRVVRSEIGSLALGVQWLFTRAIGTIPGPIIFGKAIDLACLRWLPTDNGDNGNCLMYDHDLLSRNLCLMIQSFKLVGLLCFCIALYFAWKDEKNEPLSSHEVTARSNNFS